MNPGFHVVGNDVSAGWDLPLNRVAAVNHLRVVHNLVRNYDREVVELSYVQQFPGLKPAKEAPVTCSTSSNIT